MKQKWFWGGIWLFFTFGLTAGEPAAATDNSGVPAAEITLPEPVKTGGMALRDALAARCSGRAYAPGKIFSQQQLSDMLWAANGQNRPDGRTTAPTARNWQEIAIYVALPQGVYLYNVRTNKLSLIHAGDIRKQTGKQPFVGQDTIEIILVADFSKMQGCTSDMLKPYAYIDSGYISQNLYLFAAANGYATVVRGMVPRETLAPILKLGADQQITVVQTIGFAPVAGSK